MLCASQIQDFPGMLNFYHISVIQFFKSNWPEVRAGAAMFIGTSTALRNIAPCHEHDCIKMQEVLIIDITFDIINHCTNNIKKAKQDVNIQVRISVS